MNNFEGTWESTWLGANPNPDLIRQQRIAVGIESLLRIGQRDNHVYFLGKGNFGNVSPTGLPDFQPGWNMHARTDLEERLLIGRFWNPMWNQFTNDSHSEQIDDERRDSFLHQSGQFFFELGEDGKTFKGGYNASSQPTHWFAWDGRKISHNPRYRKSFNPSPFPARDLLTVVVTPPSGLF